MRFDARPIVRAILPALPVALSLGCSMNVPEPSPHSGPARGVITRPAGLQILAARVRDAEVGVPFEFQAATHNTAGSSLKFSAENLPPWARIDAGTGRISGTPGPHDVGAYESVSITAANATEKALTAPFTITVLGELPTDARVVATVSWDLPPSKNDGSPLDDLAGYRILYGRNAEDLDQSILVMNPGATSYNFSALGTGVWYFAVVAVNANGLEGPATLPAMKSI